MYTQDELLAQEVRSREMMKSKLCDLKASVSRTLAASRGVLTLYQRFKDTPDK
jgi:hypothetical protein